MLHPDEWPFRHGDLRQSPHRPDAPVPLRHDIALAHYLERQRAYRLTAIPIMDLRGDVRRLLALATPILSILSAGVLKEYLRRR
ncbi:hypothetical protein MPLB_1850014 [Mesorhizobium sp. ORS 3324]|nr:hypothetical protein MPLB_1850014 [Mesorhizobium sp. ORS 3324]